MPPGHLIIIDDLKGFVHKLLKKIADESDEGRKYLISAMQAANKQYQDPCQFWITGWIYRYYRTRREEINQAIKSMENERHALTRLEHFKTLVTHGEWESTSFNYCLFLNLVNHAPGYAPLSQELTHGIILRIKELIIEKIDVFITECVNAQQAIEISEQKRLKILSSQKSANDIHLFNRVDAAIQMAQKQSAALAFCLIFTDKKWKLSWIDLIGKEHELSPNLELFNFLSNHKIADISTLNPEHVQRVKRECLAIQEEFLKKVSLEINPVSSNEELIAKGTLATFVLRGGSKHYSLSWINLVGKTQDIALDTYPLLKQWLISQEQLGKEQSSLLKMYLLHVKTAQALNQDEFKGKLSRCLHKSTSIVNSEQLKKELATSSLVNPAPQVTISRLDLNSFSKIADLLEEKYKRPQPKQEVSLPNITLLTPDVMKPKRQTNLNLGLFDHIAQHISMKAQTMAQHLDEPSGSADMTH